MALNTYLSFGHLLYYANLPIFGFFKSSFETSVRNLEEGNYTKLKSRNTFLDKFCLKLCSQFTGPVWVSETERERERERGREGEIEPLYFIASLQQPVLTQPIIHNFMTFFVAWSTLCAMTPYCTYPVKHNLGHASGQSSLTIVNYECRVVIWAIFESLRL